MRNDLYFRYDASASSDGKLMNLIASEGLKGYGAYWILLEALRRQTDYKASVNILAVLAFRFQIRKKYLLHIIRDFGLFILEDEFFYSKGMLVRLKQYIEKYEKKSVNAIVNNMLNSQNNNQVTGDNAPKKDKIRLKSSRRKRRKKSDPEDSGANE